MGPLGPCVPPWALVCPPGPLWAGPLWPPPGPLWAPWALVGPPGSLWARPLWAPWALVGRALVGPLGPCGLPWALVGPCGPSPCGPPWALMGRALISPPNQGSYAPWRSGGVRDPLDICLCIRYGCICVGAAIRSNMCCHDPCIQSLWSGATSEQTPTERSGLKFKSVQDILKFTLFKTSTTTDLSPLYIIYICLHIYIRRGVIPKKQP